MTDGLFADISQTDGPTRDSSAGWTYMVLDERAKRIKIGYTGRLGLQARVDEVARNAGGPVRLIGCFAKGRDMERQLHRRFNEYRLHGEWFDWNDHIAADIAAVLEQFRGFSGWPPPRVVSAVASPVSGEATHHVQPTLPGMPYGRRRRSHLLRSSLDGRPMPETVQTGIVDYYTPRIYVDAARLVMGGIDLDPASCAEANAVVGATVFYDDQTDGLKQQWVGRVFMNPPWSGAAQRFMSLLLQSYRRGDVTQAICVLNATYTDRRYMREVLDKFPFCLTDHRVRYGGAGRQGTGGTMFCYFGARTQTFVDVFSQFGPVVMRLKTTEETVKPRQTNRAPARN